MCGENSPNSHCGLASDGSSPRVRGKLRFERLSQLMPGLIPACAGKTMCIVILPFNRPAHPRVCGENVVVSTGSAWRFGSSPRVRGKHPRRPGRRRGRGLIPACAGKTSPTSPRGSPTSAHPRVCGENSRCAAARRGSSGSSPRVRGKHLIGELLSDSGRLIPACAGKTATAALARR